MNESRSIFEKHPKLATFRKNYMQQHPGENFDAKNLYVIQSINQDGIVTNEQYGLNLVTDGGLAFIRYDPLNINRTFSLLEGVPASDKSSVMDYKFPSYTRKMDHTSVTANDSIYPMSYDSETGVISQYRESNQYIFDYNISGFDTDLEANCIIYYISSPGYSTTPILKITTYDENGLPAPIVKHLNEKLVIQMYTTNSCDERVIHDAYDRGICISMNPGNLGRWITGSFPRTYRTRFMGPAYATYSKTGSGNSYTYTEIEQISYISDLRYIMQNGEFSDYQLSGWTILSDPRVGYTKSTVMTGTVGGHGFTPTNRLFIADEIRLDTPEEIVCDIVYTDNNETGSIGNTFGFYAFDVNYARGMIPVADFSLSSVKGYNFTSHEWDIDIPFIDEPDACYENPFASYKMDVGIMDASPRWGNYVYTNPRAKNITGRPPAVPVTSLKRSSSGTVFTMYATDKWWDGTTWELIPNISSIPQSLQNKKYFISSGGDNDVMIPTYDQNTHRLNVGTSHTVQNTPQSIEWVYGFRPVVNKTDGWILAQDHILFMNGNDVAASYRLEGPEMSRWGYNADSWNATYQNLYTYDGTDYIPNTDPVYSSRTNYYINAIDEHTIRYAVGNKLLVGSHPTMYGMQYPATLRLFTITDSSTAPTYIDIPVDTNTTDRRYPAMYSGTQEGYYVIQDQQTHCANIISLEDGTVVKLENVMYCFALEYSKYCIYMDYNSSPIMFHVYDMTTNTIKTDFVLPSEYSNIVYICGWRDLVYIKSKSGTSSYVNVVNIDDGSVNISSVTFSNEFTTAANNSTSPANNAWRMNMIAGQSYTRDIMILFSLKQADYVPTVIKYDDPDVSFKLFKNGTLEERPIDTAFERNTYEGRCGGIDSYLVHDIQSNTQSKLLFVNTWGIEVNKTPANQYALYDKKDFYGGVSDIGAAVVKSSPMNACQYHNNNYDDATCCHGGLVYWNNGIIQFDKTGAAIWRPLEWFIASQITGTTYTIQAYNNPKKIGHKAYNIFRTNRGTIQHTDVTRSSGDIQMVFVQGNVGYSSTNEQGISWFKILKGIVEGPFETKVSVPNGTTIRIEVVPVPGFEFLIGTFRWYVQDLTINHDINGDYVQSGTGPNWTSALATADDENQTNGTSITLDRDVNLCGICIGTTSSELQVLSAAMIKSIKITTDPHLST